MTASDLQNTTNRYILHGKSRISLYLTVSYGRRMVAEWFVMSEVKQAKAVAGVYMIKFKKVMSWSQKGHRMVARFLLFLLKHGMMSHCGFNSPIFMV